MRWRHKHECAKICFSSWFGPRRRRKRSRSEQKKKKENDESGQKQKREWEKKERKKREKIDERRREKKCRKTVKERRAWGQKERERERKARNSLSLSVTSLFSDGHLVWVCVFEREVCICAYVSTSVCVFLQMCVCVRVWVKSEQCWTRLGRPRIHTRSSYRAGPPRTQTSCVCV